jgi:hypothetical protein
MQRPRISSLRSLLSANGRNPNGRNHLSHLTRLWVSSVVSAGANFATTFLLLGLTTPTVFAAYIFGLTLQQLSSTWVDGGLSAALQIITTPNAQSSMPPGVAWVASKRLRLKRFAIATICLASLLVTVYLIGSTTIQSSNYLAVGLFVFAGFLDGNSSLRNAFLYSQGLFRRFSMWQLVSSTGRLLVVAGLAALGIDLTATNIAFAILFVSAVSFAFAVIATVHILGGVHDVENVQGARNRLKALATPLGVGAYLDSISHHLSVIAASAIAQPTSLAIFGAFQRINQIYAANSNPLLQYFGRSLRVQEGSPEKRRSERRLLQGTGTIYLAFACAVFFVYVQLSKSMSHYALNHKAALVVFLIANFAGAFLTTMNQILYARGHTEHRMIGPALLLAVGLGIWVISKPVTLIGVVFAYGLPILLVVIYYGWRYWEVAIKGTANSRITDASGNP